MLRNDGGDRVYAFTRSRDMNSVLVAVNFADAAVRASYSGLGTAGSYTDWFDRSRLTLSATGQLVVPANGYRILVRR